MDFWGIFGVMGVLYDKRSVYIRYNEVLTNSRSNIDTSQQLQLLRDHLHCPQCLLALGYIATTN